MERQHTSQTKISCPIGKDKEFKGSIELDFHTFISFEFLKQKSNRYGEGAQLSVLWVQYLQLGWSQ